MFMRAGVTFALIISVSLASAQVILDSHTHLFSPQQFGKEAVTAKDVVAMLDKARVDKAVVLSGAYWFTDKAKEQAENDFVASEVAKEHGRLIGFCAVNPSQGWALEEFDRCIQILMLRGLKLHAQFDKLDLRDPAQMAKIESLIAKAGKFGVPVLIDSIGWDIREEFNFLEMVSRHSESNVILAHAFLQRFRDLAIPLMLYQANPNAAHNLYVDVSAIAVLYQDSPEKETLVWYLRKLGMDHVLFGSDFPVFTSEKTLAAIRQFGFSKAELDQVLGQNAFRLLGQRASRRALH